jgi:hypothetical protein
MENKYRSALFDDPTSADAAYTAALKRGHRPEDINIIMSEDSRKKYSDSIVVQKETSDQSLEGMAIGGALGGAVMATVGSIMALTGAIVIPGLGLIIAGPLAAGLVGAGTGSVAGGIIGALVGAGFPEEHAKLYDNGIQRGGIVVAVPAKEEDTELLEDWKRNRARDIF